MWSAANRGAAAQGNRLLLVFPRCQCWQQQEETLDESVDDDDDGDDDDFRRRSLEKQYEAPLTLYGHVIVLRPALSGLQ